MKIGLVGCGGVGNVHAKSLLSVFEGDENFNLFLCDIKEEHLNSFQKQYGGKTYDSLEKMLENEDLDAIHIATPHYLHVPMAIYALQKGVNVIMEKPPAITIQELHNLLEVEKNSSARLGVCFQNRYNPSSILMKDYVENKTFGEVLGARAFVTWKREKEYYTQSDWRGNWYTEGGGVLTNQSIHTLDLLNYFLGKPVCVEGTVSNKHLKGIIEVEDTAEAYIDYGNFKACYYATTAYAVDSNVFIEIVFENMTVRIDGDYVYHIKNGRIVELKDLSKETENNVKPSKCYWGKGHQSLIADFYDKLAKNEKFDITINDCKDTIKLVWGIYNSSKTNSVIPL